MCLNLCNGTHKSNNRKAFIKDHLKRDDGLIILHKWVQPAKRTKYSTPFQYSPIYLNKLNISDRPTRKLTTTEKCRGFVAHGFHLFTAPLSSLTQYNLCVCAIVHINDFVAYDRFQQVAVFMQAIYTEKIPPEHTMQKYAKMLKESNGKSNQTHPPR